MTFPIRSILALSVLMIVLAACGTTIGAPASQAPSPTEPAAPSVQPSVAPSVQPSVEPSVEPSPSPAPADQEREVAGTITVAEGMAFSGPGATIQEALDTAYNGEYPSLVNGVLFRDTDGTVYLATSVSDITIPTFDAPLLEVLNTPNDGPSWDMANAELLLLEEANGIIFRQESQILGYIETP